MPELRIDGGLLKTLLPVFDREKMQFSYTYDLSVHFDGFGTGTIEIHCVDGGQGLFHAVRGRVLDSLLRVEHGGSGLLPPTGGGGLFSVRISEWTNLGAGNMWYFRDFCGENWNIFLPILYLPTPPPL